MKIGIFTLPLGNNYGGLLQAFALQNVIAALGHEVVIVRRPCRFPAWIGYAKRLILSWFGRVPQAAYPEPGLRTVTAITREMSAFVQKYLRQTPQYFFCSDVRLRKLTLDVCVVGSDQVWRPAYTANIAYFFLTDWDQVKIRRIAYAASFGIDEWTFSEAQTIDCRRLLQQFDAISVREQSGVELCQKYLHAEAQCVLDPTMVADLSLYTKLAEESPVQVAGKLAYYILAPLGERRDLVEQCARLLGLEMFPVMMDRRYWQEPFVPEALDQFTFPSVSSWLKAFRDAAFVVTDSFHGCVFSILFRRPFVVMEHGKGGNARFKTLLSTFGLEDRLISRADQITPALLFQPIDFDAVHAILQREKTRSLDFLKQALDASLS